MDSTTQHTNHLIHETSPYLLQHAHNPVDWYPWGEEALEKAKNENKVILVSIGYSACHWCHVMERESFEDAEVAKIMNEHFVCIKVDREERPDIDQIYMDAVQLMTQRGGWPLNCFATPEGKPFFGGTYFPKSQWMNVLERVHNEYKNNREKVDDFANRLTQGVQSSGLIELNTAPPAFELSQLSTTMEDWVTDFDTKDGGPNRAPKFPLPNNYLFLLRYAHLNNNEEVMEQVRLTLDKMARGGIYDQIGGGFARYSTDIEWKVPHFEKMLYDNAQLVSLYSEAWQATKDPEYKRVVYETLAFIERELRGQNGEFYSALDADSEGEEGKFYIWTKEELKASLGIEDYNFTKEYYNINLKGLWEHGNYILLRDTDDESFAKAQSIDPERLEKRRKSVNERLMEVRSKRIRPGLDDKSLTSWNALMLKGYVDAYLAFGDQHFLDVALKNADFILKYQLRNDGGLYHNHKAGKSTINGYLEDYCFTIEAFIALYQATLDEKWLNRSKELLDYTIEHFLNADNGMFYFTSDLDNPLVARKMEVYDNVIPASNSSMAKGLFYLGHYFDRENYLKMADNMLNNVVPGMGRYPSGHSNWSQLMLHRTLPFYEVAISGKEAVTKREELTQNFLPNTLLIGSEADSKLPLLENKYVKGETMIYVCLDKVCQLPVSEVAEALKQIH